MSEITSITPQVKDKKRCNIFLDGRFYCGLTLEATVKNRLKEGMQIDPSKLDEIQLESERMTALDKALNYISATQKTEKQVRKYLDGKGYLPNVIDFVIDKMKGYSFLDDDMYAKNYASSAIKRKGSRLIKMELINKGVSSDAADEAVDNLEGEEETAFKIIQKYMRNKNMDKETLYKGFRYLLSKGFDYEIARNALSKLGNSDLTD